MRSGRLYYWERIRAGLSTVGMGRKEGEAGQGAEGDRLGHRAGSKKGINLTKTHDPSVFLIGLFLPSLQPRAGPQQAVFEPAVPTLLW